MHTDLTNSESAISAKEHNLSTKAYKCCGNCIHLERVRTPVEVYYCTANGRHQIVNIPMEILLVGCRRWVDEEDIPF